MKIVKFVTLTVCTVTVSTTDVSLRATGGYIQPAADQASFTHYSGCGGAGAFSSTFPQSIHPQVFRSSSQHVERPQQASLQRSTSSRLVLPPVRDQGTLAGAASRSLAQPILIHPRTPAPSANLLLLKSPTYVRLHPRTRSGVARPQGTR
jgi:hypothetical protein